MPLDPRIVLGVESPPAPNPLQALSAVAQLQAVRENADLRREQIDIRRQAADAARQKAADDAAIRRVMTETGGDIEKALPQLRTIAPAAALKLETDLGEARQKKFAAMTEEHKFRLGQLDLGIGLLDKDTDPTAHRLIYPLLQTMSPEVAEMVGSEHDPAKITHLRNVAISAKQVAEERQKALDLWAKGDLERSVATALSSVRPEEGAAGWDAILQNARDLGAPSAVLSQFGTYSPANLERARSRTISPEKQAELTGQAATRAQTEAHQTAQEAIQRGQLAVSQGQLGVARQREAREAAATVPGGVKLSATQQEDISTMLTVEGLVNDVGAIDKQAGGLPGVGPVEGRFLPSVRGSGGTTGEALRNKIGNIQGTIAKLRGGTSFTPTEQALLETYTPTTTDTDAAIRTKLATLKDFIQKKRENTLRVAKGEYTLPTDTTGRDTGGGSVSVTAPNGKTYTFKSAVEAAAFKKRAGIP